jgi:hypothetical protein
MIMSDEQVRIRMKVLVTYFMVNDETGNPPPPPEKKNHSSPDGQ